MQHTALLSRAKWRAVVTDLEQKIADLTQVAQALRRALDGTDDELKAAIQLLEDILGPTS